MTCDRGDWVAFYNLDDIYVIGLVAEIDLDAVGMRWLRTTVGRVAESQVMEVRSFQFRPKT